MMERNRQPDAADVERYEPEPPSAGYRESGRTEMPYEGLDEGATVSLGDEDVVDVSAGQDLPDFNSQVDPEHSP